MRKRHAREIRKGILLARKDWNARWYGDTETLIESTWEMINLTGLSREAFRREHRRDFGMRVK